MNVRYKLKKIRHKAINFIEGGDQKLRKSVSLPLHLYLKNTHLGATTIASIEASTHTQKGINGFSLAVLSSLSSMYVCPLLNVIKHIADSHQDDTICLAMGKKNRKWIYTWTHGVPREWLSSSRWGLHSIVHLGCSSGIPSFNSLK